MRLLVQRVKHAKVTVEEEVVGEIGVGLLALLGIRSDDTADKILWMVQKLLKLRIFTDDQGKMNRSVRDIEGNILLVSQFTLYGDCHGGNRPSFTDALGGEAAEALYNQFVGQLKVELPKAQTGRFGAAMEVDLLNHGPVTLLIER